MRDDEETVPCVLASEGGGFSSAAAAGFVRPCGACQHGVPAGASERDAAPVRARGCRRRGRGRPGGLRPRPGGQFQHLDAHDAGTGAASGLAHRSAGQRHVATCRRALVHRSLCVGGCASLRAPGRASGALAGALAGHHRLSAPGGAASWPGAQPGALRAAAGACRPGAPGLARPCSARAQRRGGRHARHRPADGAGGALSAHPTAPSAGVRLCARRADAL